MAGAPAATIRLHGEPAPGDPVMFSDHEGIEFVTQMIHHLPSFRNEITISTLDFLFEMEVTAYAERIAQPLKRRSRIPLRFIRATRGECHRTLVARKERAAWNPGSRGTNLPRSRRNAAPGFRFAPSGLRKVSATGLS